MTASAFSQKRPASFESGSFAKSRRLSGDVSARFNSESYEQEQPEHNNDNATVLNPTLGQAPAELSLLFGPQQSFTTSPPSGSHQQRFASLSQLPQPCCSQRLLTLDDRCLATTSPPLPRAKSVRRSLSVDRGLDVLCRNMESTLHLGQFQNSRTTRIGHDGVPRYFGEQSVQNSLPKGQKPSSCLL